MADEKTNLRIATSRSVLAGWEQMGRPAGKLEDLLQMVAAEIEVLEGIVRAYPAKAATVGHVIERYRRLASGLRSKAN